MATKILLTNRNSPWGVLVNPVASNTYQHILSWDNEEVKDWFINKYLFNDENYNYKEVLRKQSDKPITRTTATSATFTIDKDMYPDLTNEEILNKDLAIILETDQKGKENISFWAIKDVFKKAPFLYSFECELDIFFTYNVKDIFKKGLQTPIKRAMAEQFIKNEKGEWIPNIGIDSINYLTDEIEQGLDPTIFVEKLWSLDADNTYIFAPIKSQAQISRIPYNKHYYVGQGSDEATTSYNYYEVDYTKGTSSRENAILSSLPYHIIDLDNIPQDAGNILLHFPDLQGATKTPIKMTIMEYKKNKLINDIFDIRAALDKDLNYHGPLDQMGLVELNLSINTGTESFLINTNIKTNYSTNINDDFNINFCGKIFKSDYNKIEIIDYLGNNYIISNSLLDNILKINIIINNIISPDNLYSHIALRGKYFDNDSNVIYGIEETYSLAPTTSSSSYDSYMAQNKSRFNNQMKNAKRHELQAKVSGVFKAVGGLASAAANAMAGNIGGAVSSAASGLQAGGTEIANAKEEVNNLKATQQDLRNQPDTINNATPYFYKMAKYKDYFFHDDKDDNINRILNKHFYQISKYRLPTQLLNSIAWYYHLAGVYYGGNLYDVNDLIDSNYYFNHVQTSGSLFENIKDEVTFSQEIRNIIDASFKQGITIWHIRDKQTFKGIKNYQVNNVWMDHLKNE